ncbi:MAG TPA: hypothetical protein VFO76_11345, partial [Candidatus Kapabacteria bacterium]|nr:hypothetical protein [Candidatus Kapabacteria bacterium]
MIIRGWDNKLPNAGIATAIGTPIDSKLLLNQDLTGVLTDPDNYVGAVNQMGIHVHWRVESSGEHFYARDISKNFNGYIEENTLITNDCYVGPSSIGGAATDGYCTAGNGSGFTPRKVTIWTDPNFGAQNGTDHGLYLIDNHMVNSSPPAGYNFHFTGGSGTSTGTNLNIGGLTFLDDDLTFIVSTSGDFEVPGSNLYTYPLTYFSAGGSINVQDRATWDFFGSPSVFSSADCSILVPATTSMVGEGSYNTSDPPSGATDMTINARLRVHGGCSFPAINFSSSGGQTELLYEENVKPMAIGTTQNDPKTAIFVSQTDGNIIDHSFINSYIPITDPDIVFFKITGSGSSSSGITSLHSTATNYSNLEQGYSYIFVNGTTSSSPNKFIFDGGIADRVRFSIVDPHFGLTIQNMTLSPLVNSSVYLFRSDDSYDYENITIALDTFRNLSGMTTADYANSNPLGHSPLLIWGFNRENCFQNLNIENNNFPSTSYNDVPGQIISAIQLTNSTANIVGNTVSCNTYFNGIYLNSVSTSANPIPITSSYLCSNTIAGLTFDNYIWLPYAQTSHPSMYGLIDDDPADGWSDTLRIVGTGIRTDHYKGYVKLNQIDGCEIGYYSGKVDKPKLVFNSITNCDLMGVDAVYSSSEPDLSGLHGASTTSGIDIGAFNTIANNGTTNDPWWTWMYFYGQIRLCPPAIVILGNTNQLWTWTNWGKNNLIPPSGHPTWDNKHLVGCSTLGSSGPAPWPLGNVDFNYWNGKDPISDQTAVFNGWVDLTGTSSSNTELSSTTMPTVTCHGHFGTQDDSLRNHWKSNPTSIENSQWSNDSCSHWFAWHAFDPQIPSEFIMQYDTLQHYVESCAEESQSYRAFLALDANVQAYDQVDTARYWRYRDWLISVIYLSQNDYYYCTCLKSIAGTYQYDHIPNAWLGVVKYMLTIPGCNFDNLQQEYDATIRARHELWQKGDTTIPEDTTI